MTLSDLESKSRACRACENLFTSRFVDPISETERLVARPVFGGAHRAPVMLIGQAPGIDEYRSGQPFQGQAGKDIKRVFIDLGVAESRIDEVLYQTSVTKCFPGRKTVKRKKSGVVLTKEEDLQPTSGKLRNCSAFLGPQIKLVQPRILVLLGTKAIDGYARLRGRRLAVRLSTFVGRTEEWNGMKVIFLPHTSGNSRWLNKSNVGNIRLFNEAKEALRSALRDVGICA